MTSHFNETLPDVQGAGVPGIDIRFDERAPGLTVLSIESSRASASLSLFGGQVLTWQPRHVADPVLWLSPSAVFDAGTALRGGAPVCWPWFGPHPSAPVPAHGYARVNPWRLVGLEARADGSLEVRLLLASSDDASIPGKLPLSLRQTIVIGDTLEIALTTTNEGPETIAYSEGLHTYFQVSDIGAVTVRGLEGASYVDLTAGNVRRVQEGPLSFRGETGRLFLGTPAACTLDDPGLRRRIGIQKFGSASTAIWNPAQDVAARMRDLGPDHWRTMACVETANALDDTLELAPQASRTMATRYTVEAWPS